MDDKLSKVKYGDVFTVDDFLADVDAGYIVDSDGYGRYHDGHSLTDEYFDFTGDVKDYPYIVWYNR